MPGNHYPITPVPWTAKGLRSKFVLVLQREYIVLDGAQPLRQIADHSEPSDRKEPL